MNKHKTTIYLTVSALVFCITGIASIFMFNVIKNKNINTEFLNNSLALRVEEKRQESFLKKSLLDVKKDNEIVDAYFVNTDTLDDFVDNLEKEISALGAVASVQRVDSAKDESRGITVGLSIDGDFASMMRGIKYIEHMPYATSIRSVSINSNSFEGVSVPAGGPSRRHAWGAVLLFDVFTF